MFSVKSFLTSSAGEMPGGQTYSGPPRKLAYSSPPNVRASICLPLRGSRQTGPVPCLFMLCNVFLSVCIQIVYVEEVTEFFSL